MLFLNKYFIFVGRIIPEIRHDEKWKQTQSQVQSVQTDLNSINRIYDLFSSSFQLFLNISIESVNKWSWTQTAFILKNQ